VKGTAIMNNVEENGSRPEQQFDICPYQIYVPVPPMLAEAIGYTGQVLGHPLQARYVGFYWERSGDEANYDDGRSSGTGEYTGYQAFTGHPKVAVHLKDFHFGSSETLPRHYLLLDQTENRLYAMPVPLAQQFLHLQWPHQGQNSEAPQSTILEVESIEDLAAALKVGDWEEVTLPADINESVVAAMQRQNQLLNDLVDWLDEHHKLVTPERIVEYIPRATAMLLHHVIDGTEFVRAGELVHIHEVRTDGGDRQTITFYRDNTVYGPDESHAFSVTGSWQELLESLEILLERGNLDDMLENEVPLEQVFGRYADWNAQAFPVVPLRDSLAIRVTLACAKCGRNPETAYACSGLHCQKDHNFATTDS
jgi:hypothetical protein